MNIRRIFVAAALASVTAVSVQAKINWEPKGDRIKTTWASQVDPQNPLPEYPRPQMVRRDWLSLNGRWDYAIAPLGATDIRSEGKIVVPYPVESSLSGVMRKVGKDSVLWYSRDFEIPDSWRGKRIMLNFGAVDWLAEVWVNGHKMGGHTGGYTPFSFDITKYAGGKGTHQIRVRVWDGTDNEYQPRGKQVANPNGIWYTPVTGIWQTVWLEPVSRKAGIKSYHPKWDAASGTLEISLETEGKYHHSTVQLLDGDEVVGEGNSIKVKSPKLWSPDSPFLYGIRIKLYDRKGNVLDSVDGYTCLRTVTRMKDPEPNRNVAGYNRFALNGERIFMFGPLDQGWWPDGLYTAPTDEALKYDVQKVREWGWNTIRKHIKVEPARWYYWCDVLGVMVWQDMPVIGDHSRSREQNAGTAARNPEALKATANVWSRDSFLGGTDCVIPKEAKANYYKEWKEIISYFKDFQSIVMWIPFNEAWGQFDTPEVVKFTREQDPTRLVNESSGGNFSLSGDVLDAHHYAAPAMNVFEGRMINVLGEYGGLGCAVDGHLWFKEGNIAYGKLLRDGREVLDVYDVFADKLCTMIDNGLAGAIYTQTTDVEGEVNGIMTYDRKVVKVDEKRFRDINSKVTGHLGKGSFDTQYNGDRTALHTLSNGSLTMKVTNFGARVVSLCAPDRNGVQADVTVGYGSLKAYVDNKGERFLGSAIGPVGNRIAGGRFTLDGVTYQLPLNNNGNTLHGGNYGFDMVVWDVESVCDTAIVFTYRHPKGLDGWPSNIDVKMTYRLTPDNEFRIDYEAVTDAPTPINLTNHTFFNLTGKADRSILDHEMYINASRTTPVDELLIPTGEFESLDGSPLDFRTPKKIGLDIGRDDRQLRNGGGYDHNWCLDRKTADGIELAARVSDPESGRVMEVWTDQPGLQFYSGNFFDGCCKDQYGRKIQYRCAFALETQKYPDSINHPGFSDTVLRPGETYRHTCIYKFR